MNTKLAALSTILLIAGCDSDTTSIPEFELSDMDHMESVFIDCSDFDQAELDIERPSIDGIREVDWNRRPDTEVPENGEPDGSSRPSFDAPTDFYRPTGAAHRPGNRPSFDGAVDFSPEQTESSPSIDRPYHGEDEAVAAEPDAPRGLPENPCDCPDTECMEQWIDAHLGCDVCATFLCSDDEISGACNTCD